MVTGDALRCAALVVCVALAEFAAVALVVVVVAVVDAVLVGAVLSATCDLLVCTAKKADDVDGCLALPLLLTMVCVRLVCNWLAPASATVADW